MITQGDFIVAIMIAYILSIALRYVPIRGALFYRRAIDLNCETIFEQTLLAMIVIHSK